MYLFYLRMFSFEKNSFSFYFVLNQRDEIGKKL